MTRRLMLLLGVLGWGLTSVWASNGATTSTLSAAGAAATAAPADTSPTAIDYLNLLEEKNKDVRSMKGSFAQTSISEAVLEETVYTGRFYYVKPNQFRIDYTGKEGKKDESTVLMLANEVWDYVPSIEQATRMRLDNRSGHQREINQFLLGFGVQAQKALEYFDVALGKKDSSGKTFTLIFTAKNPDETLQFVTATIAFDRESLRPKTIILVDSIGDRKEIALGDVEYNASIKESLFEPKWPKGTEVINQ